MTANINRPTPGSPVISCLRYRDASRAIAWLCEVLGFERHLVVPGEGAEIVHAQLTLGTGMVMLGSMTESEYGRLMRHPDDGDGRGTQSVYLVVGDADAIYRRVVAGGAKVEIALRDETYGGRGFTCRDPEGHLWTIGTYQPWTA